MSLKENIEMVKEELNQEEKMFENAVRTERFVKKYKMPLIGALTAIVVVLVGNTLYQANVESKIASSNEAYMKLLKSPTDAQAIKTLKENNSALYDAWQLKLALENGDKTKLESLKSSKYSVVSDLAFYESATLNKDTSALNIYTKKENAIYKDMALLDASVLLMQAGKTEEAKEKLSEIDNKSSLKKTAQMLQHYGVK